MSVVYGDRHGIQADPACEKILYSVIGDTKPNTIINIGDDVDCYTISDYDRNPQRVHNLQEEIDNTRAHLHKVAQLAPTAEKFWLEGNHEDRFRRLIWRLPGATAELARLRIFQQTMTWPSLVGTDQIGWGFVPSHEQTKRKLLPGFIVKHGTKLASHSAGSAKLEMTRYGRSGLSGHCHRLGSYYRRDHNGSHIWQETGCLCRLDTFTEYVVDPDWQQGLIVIEHTADGKRFAVYPVYIQDGRAIFRQTLYSA